MSKPVLSEKVFVRMLPEDVDSVQRLAASAQVSLSALIRQWVRDAISQENLQQKAPTA